MLQHWSVSSNNQSWGSDNSNFVNSSNRWFQRGGNANNGSNAGLFNSNNNGNNNTNNDSRAALLALPAVYTPSSID